MTAIDFGARITTYARASGALAAVRRRYEAIGREHGDGSLFVAWPPEARA